LIPILLCALSVPAQAQMMSSDSGIRKPQAMQVAQRDMTEPEDPDFDTDPMDMDMYMDMTDAADPSAIPVVPTEPIDPFSPAPVPPVTQQQTKQVLKKIPNVKVQRSIADDRIDDSYVQEMIKNNFNFSNTIE